MEKDLSTIESQLLILTRQFLLEQETERAVRAVALDASLERQLGIDSLGKVELFHRIEKHFGVQLSDKTMAEGDTVKEIAEAVLLAKPAKKFILDRSSVILQDNSHVDLSKVEVLQEALIEYAVKEPARPHIYLQQEDGAEELITYGDLLARASSVANTLIDMGVRPDDTVAIMLPTCKGFFQSFFGVLLAGAVPVPIYPPFRMDRIEEYALREAKILNNAEVRVLITFSEAEKLSKILQGYIPSLKAVVNMDSLLLHNGPLPRIARTSDQPALIQYTSGSTGDPKGILLFHQNILANLRAIEKAVCAHPTDVGVSWLPLYHDMGLMSWISSLFLGIPITIMSPLSFLHRPERWLWSIHYHRGTLSAAPNFAYELCVKKIDDEALVGLDLSCLRLTFNGAEAVNPKTLERFYQRFKKYGLKKEALCPIYGLAEDTVGLTAPVLGRPYRVDYVAKDPFEQQGRAIAVADEKGALPFVSVGVALCGHELRIVDDHHQPCAERVVGNIQFRGPSAMQGYYKNPVATKAAYCDGWWETGDLGYLADGELFVTGRKKDLIIKAGRNLYPEMIEEVAMHVEGVRKGCVIAFGVSDPTLGTEKMIIVAESALTDPEQQDQLRDNIKERVAIEIGVPPDQVVIAPIRKIPKTSSGKLQRSQCKQMYLHGELTKKNRSLSWQITKLWFTAAIKRLSRWGAKSGRLLYTLYMAVIFMLAFIPTWLIVLLTPKKYVAKVLQQWVRFLFCLACCPIVVDQPLKLRHSGPLIYAANHFSYLDSMVMLAVLPPGTILVGKKEIMKIPLIATVAKKCGFLTVDRWDIAQNIEDVRRMKTALESGKSMMIYPEGTFTYASGLRPFKAGAFQLSVDTGVPICPIAIKNTRKCMRGDSLLIAPAQIFVTVCEKIIPLSNDWQEVVRLRSVVRQVIARHCGEPTVDLIVAGPETSMKHS